MKTDTAEDHRQPLLFGEGYSEDPAGDRCATHAVEDERDLDGRPLSHYVVGREAQNRLARDMLVFLFASILWVLAIFVFLPWPTPYPSPASTSSVASSTTTTTTTTTQTTPPPPTTMEEEENGGALNEHGILKDTSRFHNVTSGAKLLSCGNSTVEALAAGCQYDTLLNAWVPARCLDREWIEEYQDDGSWAAFEDQNLTKPLAAEEMGMREHYYTSVRDHVNHCAMLWRKQFWTLFEARRVFDSVIVNSYHTEHCAEFLSNLMTMERTEPTLVKVGFSGCWVRDDGEEL